MTSEECRAPARVAQWLERRGHEHRGVPSSIPGQGHEPGVAGLIPGPGGGWGGKRGEFRFHGDRVSVQDRDQVLEII